MHAGRESTLIIDFGPATAAALVATEQGSWLVPDPVSGESRWPCALHWDGQWTTAGAAALQRAQVDPSGYATNLRRALDQAAPVTLGARRLRPVELVAEYFAALRAAAGRMLGAAGASPAAIERAVVTIPAGVGVTDPLRSQLVGAAEAAGFTAVELLVAAAGAVGVPGSPLRAGEVVLVYDLEATFEATLVRVGDEGPEVLGHGSIQDWPGAPEASLEVTMACCRDVFSRSGIKPGQVSWVLPVGRGARAAGLVPLIEQGLGIAVAIIDEPELAVIRGAAVWLLRSGPRSVVARGTGQRMVPLTYTIPGGTARLVRWLVEPRQQYEQGEAVARIRLAGGALWDLTARTAGTVDEVLVAGGREVRSGEWLALVRVR